MEIIKGYKNMIQWS